MGHFLLKEYGNEMGVIDDDQTVRSVCPWAYGKIC